VGNGTPVPAALRQATTTIAIVFVAVHDPVGQGFVLEKTDFETGLLAQIKLL
jgi:ABC-type uncharacterized transport system substrate-binding protein